jgi:guanosine-3',5'-bis(diphosphate) 3'-pyrophosphohydrolase
MGILGGAWDDIHLFIRAVDDFAAAKHRNQRRKDEEASPYINHPIALTAVLKVEGRRRGLRCPERRAAARHDRGHRDHARGARARVRRAHRGIVAEVSDDTTLKKEDRKRLQVEHAARISREAKLVKLADKICNVRDMLDAPPAHWNLDAGRSTFDWAEGSGGQPARHAPAPGAALRRGLRRQARGLIDSESNQCRETRPRPRRGGDVGARAERCRLRIHLDHERAGSFACNAERRGGSTTLEVPTDRNTSQAPPRGSRARSASCGQHLAEPHDVGTQQRAAPRAAGTPAAVVPSARRGVRGRSTSRAGCCRAARSRRGCPPAGAGRPRSA